MVEGFGWAWTGRLPEADVGPTAWRDVPLALSTTLAGADRAGTATCACSSTWRPALSPDTVQVRPPAGWHTLKCGLSREGLTDSVTLAVASRPAVIHTQTANWAFPPGRTNPRLFSD